MGPNRRGIPRFARNDTILEGLFPQRLKPLLFCIPYGTAEAVPCKDLAASTQALSLCYLQQGVHDGVTDIWNDGGGLGTASGF